MNADLFWFDDEQWLKVAPHLPTNQRGPERHDGRRILSGIMHVQSLKSDVPSIIARIDPKAKGNVTIETLQRGRRHPRPVPDASAQRIRSAAHSNCIKFADNSSTMRWHWVTRW